MGARKKGVKLVGGITDMGRQAGANRWRLRSKSKATPISKTFATKKEAEDYQKLVSQQLHESGTRHSEIVLTGSTQKHLQAALDTGIQPEDLKDAAELWLASTRSAEGKDLTLGEAVEQALDCDHFKTRAETTRNGYQSKWLRFVRVMTPDKKLSSIGSQTIKDYLKDLTKFVSVSFINFWVFWVIMKQRSHDHLHSPLLTQSQ